MKQISAQHGRICLVFDEETFPEAVDRLSSEIKILYSSGALDLAVLSAQYSGVLNTHGLSALDVVNSWDALDELVIARNIRTLHIKAHGHWSSIPSATVFEKWRSVVDLKVLIEAVDRQWDLEVLKKCSAMVVYTHEARLRLLGSGLPQNRVILRPRCLDPVPGLPRTQRVMLRKAYEIPEGPLVFSRIVSDQLANALRDHWHIITPDVNAPRLKNVTCFDASNSTVECGFLRAADAILCDEADVSSWYLKEAIDWSIQVFTTVSAGVEDLRPMVVASSDPADLILQLNGYAEMVLTDATIHRDHWFSMRALVKDPLSIIEVYNDLWNRPLNVSPPIEALKIGNSSVAPARILMQNRSNAEECPGGDTVVMHRFADILRQIGVQVDIEHGSNVDYSKYDLVHLFNFALPDVLEGYARKAMASGKPFVVTALNEDIPEFYLQGVGFARHLVEYVKQGQKNFTWNQQSRLATGRAARFNNDWVAANADRIICCGARESATVLRDYPSAKVAEVKFGINKNLKGNKETMRQAYGIREYVLCVGRLEFRKNQLGLLKALEHTDHTIVFATGGFSYSPEYDEACRMFKRKGRTIFLERLSEQDLADVYEGARVHALPSWYELPGLVSLEAALHGCEIVVTDRGTIRDYVGEMAHYCEADNIESIRHAIEEAYRMPRSAGLERVLEALTWENSTRSLMSVYDEILRGQRRESNTELPHAAKVQPSRIEVPVLKASTLSSPIPGNPIQVTQVLQYDVKQYETALEAGEIAAKNNDYPLAERELSKAIALSGGTSRAHRSLAAVFYTQEKYQAAVVEFEKAVKAGGEDARNFCGYGMGLLAVDRVEEAHGYLLRSLRIEPHEAVTIFYFVQTAYRLNRFDDLVSVLTEYCAFKGNDLDVDMKYCLAGALYRCGDYKRASEENQEILCQQPAHKGAQELQQELNKKLHSERERTRVIEADVPPRKDDLLQVSARFSGSFDDNDMKLVELEDLKRAGEFDKVKEGANVLIRNLQLRPDQLLHAQLYHAEAMLLSGQVEEGSRTIKELFDRNGNDQKVLCTYAALVCFEGKWEEGAQLFQRALNLNPRNDVALAGLGGCLQQRGDSEKAWIYFKEAVSINVECKRGLLGLIQLGHEKRRYAELESCLNEYLELHPADLDFVYAMAGCLFAQEKYDAARDKLNIIRIFDANNERMNELLKIIDERVGSTGETADGAGKFGYQKLPGQLPVM